MNKLVLNYEELEKFKKDVEEGKIVHITKLLPLIKKYLKEQLKSKFKYVEFTQVKSRKSESRYIYINCRYKDDKNGYVRVDSYEFKLRFSTHINEGIDNEMAGSEDFGVINETCWFEKEYIIDCFKDSHELQYYLNEIKSSGLLLKKQFKRCKNCKKRFKYYLEKKNNDYCGHFCWWFTNRKPNMI